MKRLLFLSSLLFCFSMWAQQPNIAPQATVTATGASATLPPSALNDLDFGTCGTQQMWVSTSNPPSTVAGVDWIQWDWPMMMAFDEMTIHHGDPSTRFLTGFLMQYWDGDSWEDGQSFSNLPQQCSNTISFQRIMTDRMRITKYVMGTGQTSNPNFREVEIFQASISNDDAGVVSSNPVPAVCPGSYPVEVVINNFGLNQIDSLEVHWQMDGVAQPTLNYTSLLDTIGGAGSPQATVNLGSFNFQPSQTYTLKSWTSLPNGVADTINDNDTLEMQVALGAPTGLALSNITSRSADVSWTSIAGSTYGLIYGPSGFDPSTGGTTVLPASEPYGLTGLSPTTSYDVYLFADCGGGVYSDTAAAVSFATLIEGPRGVNCPSNNPVTLFTEEFNDVSAGWTGDIGGGGTNGMWNINSGSTSSSGTGPSGAHSGSNYIYYEASGTAGIASVVSPLIDLSQATDSAELAFWMHAYGGNMGYLVVRLSTASATGPFNDTIFLYNQGELQTSGSDPWQQVGVRLDQYVGDSIWLEFETEEAGGFTADLAIDLLTIETCGNICVRPSTLYANNFTIDSADIGWTENSGATSWDIEFGPIGFVPTGTPDHAGVTSNPFRIGNLQPSTGYDFYVRSDCGGASGLSPWSGPFTFYTPLAGPTGVTCPGNNLSTVFLSEFDDQSVWSGDIGTANGMWRYNSGGTGSFGTGPTGAHSGSNYIYFEASSSGPASLISPPINLVPATDGAELSFWLHAHGGHIGYFVIRASTTSATGPFSDTIFMYNGGQLQSAQSDPWQQVGVNLDTYMGQTVWLEFETDRAGGYEGDLALDLVEVTTCGDYCLPEIISLESIVTAQDSAVVYVDTTGDNFQLEWGPCGYTQGTGTFMTGQSPFTLTGLDPLTCYDVYIRRNCGAGNGFSGWGGPFTVLTDCPDVFTAPYSTDLEFVAPGQYGVQFENCWTGTNTTNPKWESEDASGLNENSSGTGPYYDHTMEGHAGGTYWYLETSGGSLGDEDNLISKPIDLTALSQPSLYFWYHMYGQDMGNLHVDIHYQGQWYEDYVMINGQQQIAGNSPWEQMEANLADFAGDTIRIRFRGERGSSYASDMSIDDISVGEASSCTPPVNFQASNITTDSADLTWSSYGSSFDLEWGVAGYTPGTGTTVTGVTTPYTVSGLSPNTYYDFYIQDACDTSGSWAGPGTFKTPCLTTLSGTYTIGGPAGPTNFATLDSAVAALNGCGISGPVTFNMNGGTHGPINITDIEGANATNTVTFNGAGDSIVATGQTAAIELDGTKYISFNNIYAENNSSFVVWIHNEARHIDIDNCELVNSRTTTTFSTAVVAASGAPTSPTTADDNVNHLSITNCVIAGGYYGVSIYGSSIADHGSTVTVSDNEFEDQYYYGLRTYYMDSVTIEGNNIPTFRNTFSYGIQVYYGDYVTVARNHVPDAGYAFYIYGVNRDLSSVGSNSKIVNNVGHGSTAGMYSYYNSFTDFHHNTLQGGSYGIYIYGSSAYSNTDLDYRNNIFTNDGTGRALYVGGTEPSNLTIDYNLYYAPNGDVAYQGSTTYNTLSAWQAGDTTQNANSVEGDPIFLDPTEDFHVLGNLPNDAGDPAVGVSIDNEGTPRSATAPDIGAYEYTPVAGDLEVLSGDFIKGLCLSTNDSASFLVQNIIGSTIDFSVDPLTLNYDVSGPVNTSGSITVSTDTLAVTDTMEVFVGGIDLSVPGTYTLTAYIDSNATNALALNDTLGSVELEVREEFGVNPQSVTVTSAGDSVEICVETPFFGGGSDFFISEVSHYIGFGSGGGTVPPYLTADDYIEITGVPGSDLDGYTLEQWTTSSMQNTHTFPQGTVIGPNGTAIIAVGSAFSSTPSPSDYYYHGNVTSSYSSGGSNGRILKDPNGNIIDAVGYNSSYSFPATSGVTPADWSGTTGSTSGTAGIRLTGSDNNDASNWAVATTAAPQDANVVNAGVPVPTPQAAAGFTWTLNGVTVDTLSCTYVGPFASAGTYHYVANYTNACGTYMDTVEVIVPSCLAPQNFAGTGLSGSSVEVTWDTATLGGATFELEYGPAGFAPGTGTLVSTTGNSSIITGLANNLCMDYYLRGVCSPTENSPWIGPINICPEVEPCDDLDAYATGSDFSQSALFKPWQNGGAAAWGDAEFSSTRAETAPNSLWINDKGSNGAADVIAYFDTISSGIWEVNFDLFVETGAGAYFNIQQNHAYTSGTNYWAGEIYFRGDGTTSVEASGAIGTFNYAQNQWIEIGVVIDLDNDTTWIEYNGSSTGIGWVYSSSNSSVPLQFNGVNFYSGVQPGQSYGIDYYMDNFCVVSLAACDAPTALVSSAVGCDSAVVSWNSTSGSQSSILEYGPTGFTPGTGTVVSNINSPYTLMGLSPGTGYEVYVSDTCAGDTSAATGPISFTTDATCGCDAPTGLSSSAVVCESAVISWTSGSGSLGSILEYGPTGFTPGTGTIVSPANSPVTLTGLTAATGYDVYVSDVCIGDTSTLVGPINFTTQVGPCGCDDPTGITAAGTACDSIVVDWVSGAGRTSSIVEYGPAGFTPGTGTLVSPAAKPYSMTGLTAGTDYDVWVADVCSSDTSAFTGPATLTTDTVPKPVADITAGTDSVSATAYYIDFDASGSTGATSYDWDFGNGSNATGASAQASYNANGTYTVILTATNACGTDTAMYTVNAEGIDLTEDALGRSLSVYPNPTQGDVTVEFDAGTSSDALIRVTDVRGREIKRLEYGNVNGLFRESISLDGMAKGIYMIEIGSGDMRAYRRINLQ